MPLLRALNLASETHVPRHSVQFYSEDDSLYGAVVGFIEPALRDGDAALLVTTRAHHDGMIAALRRASVDVDRALADGSLRFLDADETLRTIVPDGALDADALRRVLDETIELTRKGKRRVRVFGEMVDVLWRRGERSLARELERRWDEAIEPHPIALLCGYSLRHTKFDARSIDTLCGHHSYIRPLAPEDEASPGAEHIRALVALQERTSALEVETRRKDEFLAMLAHELRNPLAAMRTALHLIETRFAPLPSGMERYTGILQRQTQNLVRIVDDLLDVSRITRGLTELKLEPTELAPVLSRAIDAVSELVEQKQHTLSTTLPDAPLLLHADPVRLEQVFVNLLTNAAKYTDVGGRIEIEVALEEDVVEVRVRDNGIGIAPDVIERIFSLFEQAERGLDRAQGGLGIGLTVVKSLVEMHGGTVEARSAGRGRGTELRVRLPVLHEDPATPRPEVDEREASGPGKRVLIVDDNADAAASLADLIELWGHEVAAVHDGKAALRAYEEVRPDVVLLDIGLPGMDGYEVARRLHERPHRAMLVALTGYGQESDRQQATEVGFAHHFVKPVDVERLERLLATAAIRK